MEDELPKEPKLSFNPSEIFEKSKAEYTSSGKVAANKYVWKQWSVNKDYTDENKIRKEALGEQF